MAPDMKTLKFEYKPLEIKPADIHAFEPTTIQRFVYQNCGIMETGCDFRTKPNRGRLDEIKDYIINDKSVIIFWRDGNKTVATVDDDDTFDAELGFTIAVFKYENRHSKASYKRIMSCIKEGHYVTKKNVNGKVVTETKSYLKMFMVDYFNNITFKDVEKTRKFLKSLKATGKKRVCLK